MFSLNENSRYYLYAAYVSRNQQIEGLYSLVCSIDGFNPLSGNCFIFAGKSRNTLKILRWDNDGFILIQKRLEQGTFELPRFKPQAGQHSIQARRTKNSHQIIIQRQKEFGISRITLTTGTTAQLIIYATRFVALGTDNI